MVLLLVLVYQDKTKGWPGTQIVLRKVDNWLTSCKQQQQQQLLHRQQVIRTASMRTIGRPVDLVFHLLLTFKNINIVKHGGLTHLTFLLRLFYVLCNLLNLLNRDFSLLISLTTSDYQAVTFFKQVN